MDPDACTPTQRCLAQAVSAKDPVVGRSWGVPLVGGAELAAESRRCSVQPVSKLVRPDTVPFFRVRCGINTIFVARGCFCLPRQLSALRASPNHPTPPHQGSRKTRDKMTHLASPALCHSSPRGCHSCADSRRGARMNCRRPYPRQRRACDWVAPSSAFRWSVMAVFACCLQSEDSLQEAADGVFEHVGLPRSPVEDKAPKNRREYLPMDPAVARRLRDFYAPYDEALRQLLGKESLPWSPSAA